MPYYIEARLLRSPYFLNLSSALGLYCKKCICAEWSVFSDPVTFYADLVKESRNVWWLAFFVQNKV